MTNQQIEAILESKDLSIEELEKLYYQAVRNQINK